MDLSQVGGDVSLGPLIICCYSQALVIIDKHPVSLRYSSNQVLLQPGKRTSGTKKSREKNWACVPIQAQLLTAHFISISVLAALPPNSAPVYLPWLQASISFWNHIRQSPKKSNPFLRIYPKEIIGQVPERCMYKVVRCCVLYRRGWKHINLSFVVRRVGLQNLIYTCYNYILPPITRSRLYTWFHLKEHHSPECTDFKAEALVQSCPRLSVPERQPDLSFLVQAWPQPLLMQNSWKASYYPLDPSEHLSMDLKALPRPPAHLVPPFSPSCAPPRGVSPSPLDLCTLCSFISLLIGPASSSLPCISQRPVLISLPFFPW